MNSRISRLKQMIFEKPPLLSAERSAVVMNCKFEDDTPIVIQRATLLSEVLDKISIKILDDELIVGVPGKDMKCAQLFFPESDPVSIEKEIDTLEERDYDPFVMDEEEKIQVRKLIKHWRGRTISEAISKVIDKESSELLSSGVFFTQKELGYGHCLADFERVLSEGFNGIKTDAAQNKLSDATQEQRDFWSAVEIVCDGVERYARRYAELASSMAKDEENTQIKKELLEISRICRKVPMYPAESFHEALQSVWFTQLLTQLESNGTGVSFGRLDQYLYPYYKKSIKSGTSQEELQELLDCFWIKTNHILKYRSVAAAALWAGYILNQNVTIGGQDSYGRDLTNELTYMCLESEGKLHLKEPQLSLRVHQGTPDELIEKAAQVVADGGGKPQFIGDNTTISALQNVGIPLVEARDYGVIGCVEPSIVGGWGRHKSGHLNMAKVLELTLFNGFDPIRKMQIGKKTGNILECSDFDTFMSMFTEQMEYIVSKLVHVQRDITHEFLKKNLPHVFLSMVYPDSIAKGKSFNNGGARYHWSSFTATGLANVIDSVYTIKKLVFEDKIVKMEELLKAIEDDFVGYNMLLARIKHLPKYGNGNDEVDRIASDVTAILYNAGEKVRGSDNSRVFFGFVTVTKNVAYGKYLGATPDGRRKGMPLADGISPSHGYDVSGPTAVFQSVDKIDLPRAAEGSILNQKFIPEALQDASQRRRFASLVKTYLLDLKGMHVQFNVISAETLRNAQQEPELYRDLLVRVTGFSAYFVELSKDVQDDIIGRTEYQAI